MKRRPPISTRTDTLFPYTTLFRSDGLGPQPTSSVLSPAAGLLSKPEPDQRVMATQSDSLAVSDDAWWEGRSAVEHGMVVSCRSEEHTSELQSLMRTSYAVFCLKKKILY